ARAQVARDLDVAGGLDLPLGTHLSPTVNALIGLHTPAGAQIAADANLSATCNRGAALDVVSGHDRLACPQSATDADGAARPQQTLHMYAPPHDDRTREDQR